MVHLNRQVAHLQNALQESHIKVVLMTMKRIYGHRLHKHRIGSAADVNLAVGSLVLIHLNDGM